MSSLRNRDGWLFFVLTFGWTWAFWIPAAALRLESDQPPVSILVALGGIGPTVAALSLLYASREGRDRRDYWRRVVGWRRIKARWYAVTLLAVPLVIALAALLDVLTGGTGWCLEPRYQTSLLSIMPLAAFTLFFGPLPEELGWRGYALDSLQERYGALVSSLILGILWTAWHTPLFFVQGSYRSGLAAGSVAFWCFLSDKTLQWVFMTWIYNNTERSTLSAVLFHFMVNFTGELLVLSQRTLIFQLVVWILVTAAVTFLWAPGRLRDWRWASTGGNTSGSS